MKEIHLFANAHIDPVWQWEWNEGIAAAVATFRSAADLADEFDYVFCHNEASLYKYIEKYSPTLFARIKKLIREGKWKIMGGWYLQPDCNMPSGESFVRQIMMGRRYFEEKFGVFPTTGINVDSFGHSFGLPQIMKKCGQDAYITGRCGLDEYTPGSQFLWESPDGTSVKINTVWHGYATGRTGVVDKIRYLDEFFTEEDAICVLWGVGNHGGGPSRQNLIEIKELIDSGELNVIHSDPDTFFMRLNPTKTLSRSLRTVMPGCYTTMSHLKQRHAELENALVFTEKICSAAALRGLMEYPEADLDRACEDLLKIEFHDSLPGSVIEPAYNQSMRIADHALTLLEDARDEAFFALASQQKKAGDGEYPMLVFNPNPYEWETEITVEFSLADANDTDIVSHMRIYDEEGNSLVGQLIKENSNLSMDWRKKLVFRGKLKPLDMTRFSVYIDFLPKEAEPVLGSEISVDTDRLHVEINKSTGLMKSLVIDGVEQLSREAFTPLMYEDTADPWGMAPEQLKGMGKNPVPFKLMKKPDGIFEGMAPIQLIEDGPILTAVEAFFECGQSKLRLEYDIHKTDPFVDVKADVFSAEIDKMIKLEVPYAVEGQYIGQIAFGTEKLNMDGREDVAQRFTAIENSGRSFAIINRGTHGSSVKDGAIFISLLRNAAYCAHPLDNRPLLRAGRYIRRIDMGETSFSFRLTSAETGTLERLAWEYNCPPFSLNVFPVQAEETAPALPVTISSPDVVLVTLKKRYGLPTYAARLINNSAGPKNAVFSVGSASIPLDFGKYEVKTVEYDGEKLTESALMVI